MSRRALVTGATGFVGSHLAERLVAAGWQVRALVRATSNTAHLEALGVERAVGDLEDSGALRAAVSGVDTVFHLAAVVAARTEAGYRRANVAGTRGVVEAIASADQPPRRLVYLSSYAACGPAVDGRPRRTDEPPRPLTAYGRTKLEGEAAARALEARGAEVIVIRAPAVYGPRDRALLPYFRMVRHGLAPAPGGRERRLHLIYAPDLARALANAADVEGGTYAVAEPVEHTWGALVRQIERAVGRRAVRLPLPPPLVRAAAAVTQAAGALAGAAVAFNREKAEEMLAPAWTCDLAGSVELLAPLGATPLAEGMARTVQWYRTQGWI
jgi:nucleoside-diphosphate-sugar epimerase